MSTNATTPAPAPKARERLIETASALFYERGFTNVGINEIFEHAGVARGTLYYNFGSKADLIRAVLERRITQRLAWLQHVEQQTNDRHERLVQAVELHLTWMQGDAYRGCSFLNAVIELGSAAAVVRDLTLRQKEAVRGYLEELARDAKIAEPALVSHELMLVLDGATVTALFRPPAGVVAHTRALVHRLLEAHRSVSG